MPKEREAKDTWSPTLVTSSAVCGLALVLVVHQEPVLLLPLTGIVPFILTGAFIWFWHDLISRKFRHALSMFTAVAAAAGVLSLNFQIVQTKDLLVFYAHLPQFERQIGEARAHRATREPLQIVLDYQDRSLFVTTNLFYYVVYDETDGAGPNKAGFWPYAGSSTGMIDVDISNKMHHLTGHYYNFTFSY